MENGYNVKHWLKSKKLWTWFISTLMFHAIAVLMILNDMELGSIIVEGIVGSITIGYILGLVSLEKTLAGAADIAAAVRGSKDDN